MQIPDSFFGSMSPEQFLAEYWQKKPLLVRGAWPGFTPPFTVEEFQELSMREDALARLIRRRGAADWDLHDGPFEPADFDGLSEEKWTLLIQEVDRMCEDVHAMLRVVDFLPTWRLDDIMVSYATPKGGVGAHIDNYDVFLLQGLGRRRWQIDSTPVQDEVLLEDVEVSILADFCLDEDWILEPGDMLYLPPRIAHHGEAVDPCMTFSIGCRAPSAIEIVSGLLEQAVQDIDPDERYADPRLLRSEASGRLGGEVTSWARNRVRAIVGDEDRLIETLGCLLSEPRRWSGDPEGEVVSAADVARRLADGEALRPITASRGMYEVAAGGDVLLFLSGEGFHLDPSQRALAAALTSVRGLTSDDVGLSPDPDVMTFLSELLEQDLIKFSGPV